MKRLLAITALALASASPAAHADVYRWVDEQGRVHYSDRWVPGSELIKTSRSRSAPQTAAAQREADQNRIAVTNDRLAAQQAQQAEQRAVQQDVAAARDEQCKQATERYQQAIQARRIYRTGEDGEREYLSDAEADEARLQARMDMQQACSPAAP